MQLGDRIIILEEESYSNLLSDGKIEISWNGLDESPYNVYTKDFLPEKTLDLELYLEDGVLYLSTL